MFENWTSGQKFGYGSLAAQGISSLIGAIGSISITKHQNAAAQAQANIARINKDMMERQAQLRLRQNEKDLVSLTMQAGKVKSSQRAALAANGIAVGEGSAAELQASTDIIKTIESNQMTENATRDAWGMRMNAVGYEGQALMSEAQKKSVGLTFGTTLLQGASQVANRYMLYDAMGLLDGAPGANAGAGALTKVRDVTNPFSTSTRVNPYSWGNAIKGMR